MDDGWCPAGLGTMIPHQGNGQRLYVVYYGSNSSEGQSHWWWCGNCYGLFYGGSQGRIAGTCPIDPESNNYPHDGTNSWGPYLVGRNGSFNFPIPA